MDKILVFVVGDSHKEKSKTLEVFRQYFDGNIFILEYIEQPEDLLSQTCDKILYLNLLDKARQNRKNSPVLIIKKNMISHLGNKDLAIKITEALKIDFDLLYLHRFNDKCGIMNPISGNDSLYRTYSPNGTDAILFSPTGRDRVLKLIDGRLERFINQYSGSLSDILNKSTYRGDLKSLSFSPNLFSPDISKIQHLNHFSKLNECVNQAKEIENGHAKILTGVVVSILAIGTLWILLKQRKDKDKDD